MKSLFLVLLIFRFCNCNPSENTNESAPKVVTSLGPIEGHYQMSSEGHRIEAYEGIPYAIPPIGNLRFEIAKPISSWTGVMMAKEPGPMCLQYGREMKSTVQKIRGSENCLYLNVYTRSTSSPHGSPVIFFINGNSFMTGAGSDFGPEYLLNQDVILVTSDSRSGILGFLSTEDHIVPGNMGMKDQVIALRWVKKNIGSFGGDPSRITIVGHSSGGISAQYFYLTNITAGMFQRGMSISGTVLQPQALIEKPLSKAKRVAALVGCPTGKIRSMVDCLKAQPADKIVLTIKDFELFQGVYSTVFGPVVEKGHGDFKMIDRPPMESLALGFVQDLPWYCVGVEDDGLITSAGLLNNPLQLYLFDMNFGKIAPSLLGYNDTVPESKKPEVTRLIKEKYFNKRPIDLLSAREVTKIITDWLYGIGNEKAARMHARAIRSPVRSCLFTYKGSHSITEILTGNTMNYGVSQYDDLAYLFPLFFTPTSQQDLKMQKIMTNFWVSYATNGTADMSVEWSNLNPCQTEYRYLQIAGPDKIYMNGSTNFGNKEFWETIDLQENTLPYVN
ncbi:carboxylic ester hydrolase-like isoform X1 [Neodiprion pinetum]|uniref:carboxylic ester hydrolase-like isoform X1 n=1 Tax=Neodiprion pinetum TaxID=441929 RepID=UPI001EE1484A|nr:venom carboxylesterase-6-like [Neodiprion pinetum]